MVAAESLAVIKPRWQSFPFRRLESADAQSKRLNRREKKEKRKIRLNWLHPLDPQTLLIVGEDDGGWLMSMALMMVRCDSRSLAIVDFLVGKFGRLSMSRWTTAAATWTLNTYCSGSPGL